MLQVLSKRVEHESPHVGQSLGQSGSIDGVIVMDFVIDRVALLEDEREGETGTVAVAVSVMLGGGVAVGVGEQAWPVYSQQPVSRLAMTNWPSHWGVGQAGVAEGLYNEQTP